MNHLPPAPPLTLGLLLCTLTAASSVAQPTPSDGAPWRIYDARTRQEIPLPEMVAALAPADVVFFGETHNDTVAHALEDTTYALLLARHGEVALSLEMFETDVQAVVDEYLEGLVPLDRLVGDARAWDNYREAYHPMVERARSAGQPVVAANAPRRYVSLVGRRGTDVLDELPQASRAYLPERPWRYIDTAYRARFYALMGGTPGHGHGGGGGAGEVDAAALSPIFAAQMLWDATMARSIHGQWRRGRRRGAKVFHVTGSFHSDYREGTVEQLRRLSSRPEVRTISVLPSAPPGPPNWAAYGALADFVVVHGD